MSLARYPDVKIWLRVMYPAYLSLVPSIRGPWVCSGSRKPFPAVPALAGDVPTILIAWF